ncbi:hypothetical protein [Rhodococcus erythropolis]|uniref:hypothetical protein n=1 Tax=Rhodococcus erythropolis TaxID=1833 RepID=UPI00382C42E2
MVFGAAVVFGTPNVGTEILGVVYVDAVDAGDAGAEVFSTPKSQFPTTITRIPTPIPTVTAIVFAVFNAL